MVLAIVAWWRWKSMFLNRMQEYKTMFPFWFHKIPVASRLSWDLAATRSWLMVLRRCRWSMSLFTASTLRCVINVLLDGEVGAWGVAMGVCLRAFPLVPTVAQVLPCCWGGGALWDGPAASGPFSFHRFLFLFGACCLLLMLVVLWWLGEVGC